MVSSKDLILLLGVVSLVGSSKMDMQKCPKRQGFFPKLGSMCKAYYRCSNWIPVEEICPEDRLFNPVTLFCDWMDAFPCLDKPKREECPRANGRFLKPGTECNVYYDCCNGEPTEKKCPTDQLFDPNKNHCEWIELYTCVENLSTNQPTTLSTTSTTGVISTSTESDDNQNYKTSDVTSSPPSTRSSPGVTGSSSVYTSSSGYQSTSQPHTSTNSYRTSDPNIRSSSSISVSSSPHESTSGSTGYQSSTQRHTSTSSYTESKPRILTSTRVMKSSVADVRSTTTVDIFCPEPSGYFPHPTDKHKFVGCVDDVPNILTCPANLVYIHKLRRCDYE